MSVFGSASPLVTAICLLSHGFCLADAQAGSFERLYLVGQYGMLQSYNSHFDLVGSTEIPNLSRTRMVQCAEIAPDHKRLLVGISDHQHPLTILDAETLRPVEDVTPDFPSLPSEYSIHDPLSIYSLSPRLVYFCDLAYYSVSPSFTCILLDLKDASASPILGKQIAFRSRDETVVSPSGDRAFVKCAKLTQLANLATGEVMWETRLSDESAREWVDTVTIDVDWEASETTLVCGVHGLAGKATPLRFVKFRLDLTSGSKREDEIAEPPEWSLRKPDTKLGHVLEAYGKACGRQGSLWPAIGGSLKQALVRIKPSTLDRVTLPCHAAYVSPDGRYLFAMRGGIATPDGYGGTKYVSSLTIVDLDTGEIAKEWTLSDYLVTMLFQ